MVLTSSIVNCTVRFVNDKAPKQSQVEFQLLIEGKFINDVQFSSIKVSFSDDSKYYNGVYITYKALNRLF